jgi:hypothetical protein
MDHGTIRAILPHALRLGIPKEFLGLSLEERNRIGIDEDVVVDVPEELRVEGFYVIQNQGKGKDVSSNNFWFKVAARKVKLPFI